MKVNDDHQGRPKPNLMPDENLDRIIEMLSLEYQKISDEIVVRTSGRFQFLGLMTTAAALLTTGVFSSSVFKGQFWIAAILVISVFSFGVVCFVYLGRQRSTLLRRILDIERRINVLVPPEPGFAAVLTYQSSRKYLSIYERLKLVLHPAPAEYDLLQVGNLSVGGQRRSRSDFHL